MLEQPAGKARTPRPQPPAARWAFTSQRGVRHLRGMVLEDRREGGRLAGHGVGSLRLQRAHSSGRGQAHLTAHTRQQRARSPLWGQISSILPKAATGHGHGEGRPQGRRRRDWGRRARHGALSLCSPKLCLSSWRTYQHHSVHTCCAGDKTLLSLPLSVAVTFLDVHTSHFQKTVSQKHTWGPGWALGVSGSPRPPG